MVGGGLNTPEDCAARIEAGAGFIVMGTQLERDRGIERLRELTAASHPGETVTV
jgi:heptaprenylglyceryl phosphate synthase